MFFYNFFGKFRSLLNDLRKRPFDCDDDDDDDESLYQPPCKRNRFHDRIVEYDVQSGPYSSYRGLEVANSFSYNSSRMANKGAERIIPIVNESNSDSQNKENVLAIASKYTQPTRDYFGKSKEILESSKRTEDVLNKISTDFRFQPTVTSTVVKSGLGSYGATKRRPLKMSESSRHTNIFSFSHGVRKHPNLFKSSTRHRSYSDILSPFSPPKVHINHDYPIVMTPRESINLVEREKYKQLYQRYTDMEISSRKPIRSPSSKNTYASSRTGTGAITKTYLLTSNAERILKEREKNPIKTKLSSFISKSLELSPNDKQTSRHIPFIDLESDSKEDPDIIIDKVIKPPSPPNWLERKSQTYTSSDDEMLKFLKLRHDERKKSFIDDVQQTLEEKNKWEEIRLQNEKKCFEKLCQDTAHLDITFPIKRIEILEDEKEVLPELTDQMKEVIKRAWRGGPPDQVLTEKFNIRITRRDLLTLAGLNWLNDEVINFYMNLLVERGTNDNYPSVYAFNTFFYSKLVGFGYASVRRWTKKVNIFSYDLVIIPVHLGVHWCLATIDFRKKAVKYYDSMLGDNNRCLAELQNYLESEQQDKKKSNLDFSAFSAENVKDIPQQMNGSDCGMFSCKFAEYISRDKPITFTQEDMSYFRSRMVYEIITKTLM